MRIMSRLTVGALLCVLLQAALSGCEPPGAPAVSRPRVIVRVERTPVERARLIKPGLFDQGKAAADRRRGFFDFWNEQIIREDKPVSTVFMGDSITELWHLPVYFETYGGLIENRGISGDLASHMAQRFEADVIQLKPQNVVILAGTNDISRLLATDMAAEEIVRQVTASIESMMDAAQGAGINTFVASILPTNDDFRLNDRHTPIRIEVNEKLKAMCAAKGGVYVDYASELSDANGQLDKSYARDGLHPHYAGYAVMARILQNAVRDHEARP
ncbi:MAG: hypothetical protein AMXMBFR13_20690 [Phycisphaerae bacterium]